MGPVPSGLYNPAYEHDSCGVAMVADMHGRRSRDIVDNAVNSKDHTTLVAALKAALARAAE